MTSAAANSPAAQGVIGAQGGWRAVNNGPVAVQALVPVLEPEVMEVLFQALEPEVALAQVPFSNPTSKSVVTWTVMYWEEPSGSGQDQLFPAYDLTAQYVGSRAAK